ncbi:MAG: 50S ribosomal protein L4 [Flavobacteriales bacterium]|nr:50S ribosomal protein L4 [Flavobacteriales bacterium]MCB9191480.1 50S ribosomal protein L4 [Flavobacteriales bacterium]MCB9203894.1 50S ribosomal protein L4 [Flavobacteriales bacterium]
MELAVVDKKGKATSKKVKLNDAVFGVEPNEHAIYLDVKQYLANQRQGTHSARERGEVRGSTKKIRKQKGSGGARFGDIKSPLLRGGGRVFGPRPKVYGFKLNKKLKQTARRSALSLMAKDNAITIVEDLKFDAIRTKDYVQFLSDLKLSDKKTLLVLNEQDKNVYLSSRNLEGAKVVTVSELNTYGILNANNLLLSESAVATIEKSLS